MFKVIGYHSECFFVVSMEGDHDEFEEFISGHIEVFDITFDEDVATIYCDPEDVNELEHLLDDSPK